MAKPTVMTGRWLKLVRWAGGVGRLAKKVRTKPRNLLVWCRGSVPRDDRTRMRVNQCCDLAGVTRVYKS